MGDRRPAWNSLRNSSRGTRDETPEAAAGREVRLDREMVWLTQRQMAEVFDSTPENVLMHLRNIFASGELEAEATTKEFLVVRTEGRRRVRHRLNHYNLDAIISVGYRVNTKRGVRFRQWATRTLHGHLEADALTASRARWV